MPNRTDSMISKTKGVVKGVEARMHGLVGVFKTLSEQHAEAGALLKRVKSDPGKRTALWPKIRQALVSHEKAELREVYPVLSEHAETRALTVRHDAQASELSILIDRIHTTDMASPSWGEMFDELIALVERHVHDEEYEIFPKAQAAIGVERAKDLDRLFLTAQKELAASL